MQNKQQTNLDFKVVLDNSTPIECANPECDGKIFLPTYELRRVPKTMSPTGQEAVLPLDSGFVCIKCGTLVKSNQTNKSVIETD